MDDRTKVRRATLLALETRRSVRPGDLMDGLDLPFGVIAREMDAMRKEGLVGGRQKIDLYWRARKAEEQRPMVVSVLPVVGGQPQEAHKLVECIDENSIDAQLGEILGGCLRGLAQAGFSTEKHGSMVISLRVS